MDPLLTAMNDEFSALDARSRELLTRLPDGLLFTKPRPLKAPTTPFSCGEYVVRSAAMVEKTFGGITTRLWDDPFEWTLPEQLGDKAGVLQYLDEVDTTRQKGFQFIAADADLDRQIPSPVKLRTIFAILLDTLVQASHFQGRAFAVFQTLTDEKMPRL